jgi:hypothetical protein
MALTTYKAQGFSAGMMEGWVKGEGILEDWNIGSRHTEGF